MDASVDSTSVRFAELGMMKLLDVLDPEEQQQLRTQVRRDGRQRVHQHVRGQDCDGRVMRPQLDDRAPAFPRPQPNHVEN